MRGDQNNYDSSEDIRREIIISNIELSYCINKGFIAFISVCQYLNNKLVIYILVFVCLLSLSVSNLYSILWNLYSSKK